MSPVFTDGDFGNRSLVYPLSRMQGRGRCSYTQNTNGNARPCNYFDMPAKSADATLGYDSFLNLYQSRLPVCVDKKTKQKKKKNKKNKQTNKPMRVFLIFSERQRWSVVY